MIVLFLCLTVSCSQNAKEQIPNSIADSPNIDSISAKAQVQQEEIAKTDEANYLEDTVFMSTDRDTILRHKLGEPITLTITNNKYKEVMTGEHYTIKKLEEGEWRVIPNDKFFDDLGYIFRKGSSIDFDIRLPIEGYHYEPGRYQIAKGYSVKIEEYKYDDYEVHAEITVE